MSNHDSQKRINNVVLRAYRKAKASTRTVLLFSSVVNVLLLTSPLFMLQVYDRVLLSRSEETLLFLFFAALFALIILGLVETVRNWMMSRISANFDRDLGAITFAHVMAKGESSKPIQDLNGVRGFIASPYVLALFDVPWTPFFLALVYMLHPVLGHIGLAGAIILFILAVINDQMTRNQSLAAGGAFSQANQFVEHSVLHKDAILGMGMLPSLTNIWSFYQKEGLGYQSYAAVRNSLISSIAKVVRQILQVAILAAGAYLAIQEITTAGVMIAASIIMSRALAPIEQSIQGWRSLSNARQSFNALVDFLDDYELKTSNTTLPVPEGKVTVNGAIVLADPKEGSEKPHPILSKVSLGVDPGEMVGITGPSGSGKSTLIRVILGIVEPVSGEVRIDGAKLTPAVRDQFAAYFGYLPQNIELFNGTVAQNIARFRECESDEVIRAAQLANAHELILSLPNGYDTMIGPAGEKLSGGQKQRIGLARAVFGDPKLVIFDEPTSNLDNQGHQAFTRCLATLKQQGVTTFLVAHQPSLFTNMDKMGFIQNGVLDKFGEAKQVMAELNPKRTVVKDNVVVSKSTRQIKKV